MDVSTFCSDGPTHHDLSLLPFPFSNRSSKVDASPAILSDSHATLNLGNTRPREVKSGRPSPMDSLGQIDRHVVDPTSNDQDASADIPHKRRKLNWDLVYGPFIKLYKDEGKSLAETKCILEREHGFAAS